MSDFSTELVQLLVQLAIALAYLAKEIVELIKTREQRKKKGPRR